jgi:peptidyl-tRNA hydrolase
MTLPVLYILMRNDLNSMNAGKGMAQASHASNAFVHHFHGYAQEYNSKSVHLGIETATMNGFNEWENSTTQGFGTVLTLEAKMADINPIASIFKSMGYVAGVVHDPTYPIVDGQVVHHISLDTCAYVFVPNKEKDEFASMLLKGFSLHK